MDGLSRVLQDRLPPRYCIQVVFSRRPACAEVKRYMCRVIMTSRQGLGVDRARLDKLTSQSSFVAFVARPGIGGYEVRLWIKRRLRLWLMVRARRLPNS